MTPTADEFATVAEPGSLDYYVLLFAPAAQRETLRALLVIEALLGELATAPLDQQVRHSKLGWWAEELIRYEAGNPAHPVMRGLLEENAPDSRVITPLRDLFFAIAREATEDLPDNPAALLEHAAQGGAIVGAMAVALSTPATTATIQHPTLVALAQARYLAMRFGTEHDCHADPGTVDQHARLLQGLGETVRGELAGSSRALEPDSIREWRPLLVMAALLHGPLARLGQDRPRRKGTLSELLLAWRSARRAARGKLPAFPPQESLQ